MTIRTIAAIGVLAVSVNAERAPESTRFVLLRDADAQTLRFRLNDLAAQGYHIVFASKRQFLLERRADRVADVEYRVLLPAPVRSFSQDINTAISQGYRHVPHGLIYDIRSDSPRVGAVMERPVGRAVQPAIARPASGVTRYEYQVLKNPSESRLARISEEGFDVVDLLVVPVDDYDENVFVLLARVTGAPGARETTTQFKRMRPEVASLERRLNERARQGYRLRLIGREQGSETPVLLEQSSAQTPPEYRVLRLRKGDDTLESRLNQEAARGFRLLPGRHFWGLGPDAGEALILEKSAETASSRYIVMSLDHLNAAGTLGAVTVVGVLHEARDFVPRPRVVLEIAAR